jgi:hypothetical protein
MQRYEPCVAKESAKARRESLKAKAAASAAPAAANVPDPLSREHLMPLLTRLGLPLLAAWMIGGLIAGVSHSDTVIWIALGIPAALTLAAVGLLVWVTRQARKAKSVVGILSKAGTKDERDAALAQLDARYKADDPTAVFAQAQLLMQEDPRKALEVLETINLNKVMASMADEARGQRAMIHLMLGEVTPARDLADGIQLSRHQDARSRAMLAAVVSEAWARSGQAKRAVDTLSLIDPDDEQLAQLRPQIFRAQAFAFAYTNDFKQTTRALKRLAQQDPRLLGGFMDKKTHPILQREAKKLLEQSGVAQRKMQVQRRLS